MTYISAEHRLRYRNYYAARLIVPKPSRWLHLIESLADELGARSILDYGCGANRGLSGFSRYPVSDYDPAIPECSQQPYSADLVVSIHTLEHVEPDFVDDVIQHTVSLARKAVLIVVSCEASTKVLPDGTPWHSFVRAADWWEKKLTLMQFEPQRIMMDRRGAEYAALRRIPE